MTSLIEKLCEGTNPQKFERELYAPLLVPFDSNTDLSPMDVTVAYDNFRFTDVEDVSEISLYASYIFVAKLPVKPGTSKISWNFELPIFANTASTFSFVFSYREGHPRIQPRIYTRMWRVHYQKYKELKAKYHEGIQFIVENSKVWLSKNNVGITKINYNLSETLKTN